MPSFREMVERVIELVKKRGELSVEKLAYLMNISPTYARYLMRGAAETDPDVVYDGRKLIYRKEGEAAPAVKSS
jgi:hypothetical protein